MIEDIIKFFIFVVLMICQKMDYLKFSKHLISQDCLNHQKRPLQTKFSNNEFLSFNYLPLCSGHAHVAYIHNGILYTWGKSSSGRLGNKEIGAEYHMPQPLTIFLQLQLNVISVTCGALHTIALTECGLFSWGSSRFGQLGVGEVQQTVQPVIIESLLKEKIVQIQCGQYHSLALTIDGRVFTWGWGIHGQLGHGNAEDITFPKAIESLKNIKVSAMSAGQGHTILLSSKGKVYAFGCGMFGQLGVGTTVKHCYPQRVCIPEHITHIASGYFHVLALSKNNVIYTWGCNPQSLKLQAQNSRRARHHNSGNQSVRSNPILSFPNSRNISKSSLVNGSMPQNHLTPHVVLIPSTELVAQMSCGSHHSVLVTKNGETYSWGRNSEGQIGNGTRKEQKNPTFISSLKGRRILYVSCGADFTIAVDSNGQLLGWGQNDSGQIGQKISPEHLTKNNSGSTSGRVITIRTNRRMITITQPCHQSILRPTEIIIPFLQMNSKILDSESFENEYNFIKLLSYRMKNIITHDVPELHLLDNPAYGPNALHATLKAFHHQCDTTILLNHCFTFHNFQAAAKICLLQNSFDKALEYQLRALVFHAESNIDIQIVFYIADFYANKLDPENVEMNQRFLKNIIEFCMKFDISIHHLEKFLQCHSPRFSYPLCLILFSSSASSLWDLKLHKEYLRQLPVNFFLKIIYFVLNEIQGGCDFLDLLDELNILSNTSNTFSPSSSDAFTVWDNSIPEERLWIDILNNLQNGLFSQSVIYLSGNDVDSLAKAFLSEKSHHQSLDNIAKINVLNSVGNDAVLFSCGHHYLSSSFQSSTLRLFKDFTLSLPYPLLQTSNSVLSEYQESNIIAACPKCVISELNNLLF